MSRRRVSPRQGKVAQCGPTAVIADRYKAGESIAALAEDYGEDPLNIEEAVRRELQPAKAA